jgi:hypothetical protein
MVDFWATNGFYLWALTTALVIIALAWLAWNAFGPQAEGTEGASREDAEADGGASLEALAARVTALAEATPHMQATLGRALQRVGLVRHNDPTNAQAFSLALANARGDGVVLSSSARGGFIAKPLVGWASPQALTKEEQQAVDQSRIQSEAA